MTPQQLYAHVRRGVVAVERGGVPAAIGTVLAGDGRILTALSSLGSSESVDVRYADGTTAVAKVGSADKELDLALLVPQPGKGGLRTEGLSASDLDAAAAELRAMLPTRGARLGPAGAGVKGVAEAYANGGEPLLRMLDVDINGPPVAGAPLLDAAGHVVAVLVRACKGPAPQPAPDESIGAWPGVVHAKSARTCRPVIVGAPVSAIRSFLSRVPAAPPASAPAPAAPWIGIRGEPAASGGIQGVRVVATAPSSPAEKAGLVPGTDVIVAVEGQPIDTPDALAAAIGKHAPGDSVRLLVFGGGRFRDVPVGLRPAP